MEIEAPTFNSLNKPQKRALILRDQLRWFDPQHLDSFIDGLANPEPPNYKRINGVTKPDLILVALKDSALSFELGNVIFPEEDKGVLHAYLMLEDGKIEMHTEEALTQNDQNLDHIAIHGFIAGTMVPMFKEKIGMIMARVNKVNEARRAAYNSPTIVPVRIEIGKTLSRLQAPKTKSDDGPPSSTLKHWKRRPNTPVTPHITNNRSIAGLSSIPVSLKAATFAAIPEQIKIDLFNNIASTAFPNFDNLMIASWNVVSVYSACGSDFPEMHKAVVELKDVLQDFDAAFGAKVSRTPLQYRSDWAEEAQSDNGAASALPRAASIVQTRTKVAESNKTADQDSMQHFEDTEMIDQKEGEHLSDAEQYLPAPGISQQHDGSDSESESESDSGEDEVPAHRPSDPHLRQRHERRKSPFVESSPTRFPQRTRTPSTSLTSRTPSAPPPTRSTPTLTSVQNPSSRTTKEFVLPTSPQDSWVSSPEIVSNESPSSDRSAELLRRRNEWASSQGKTNKNGAKQSQVSDTMSPVRIQQGRLPSINVIAPTPYAVASSPIVTRTSPTPQANDSSPTSAAMSTAPSLPATPAASPAINKRRASGSPTPGVARKKLLSDLTVTQLQDKARTTRTEILRKWKCFDPDVVPRQFLGLYNSLQTELERRGGHGESGAKDGGGALTVQKSSISNSQQAYDRARALDREQQHSTDRTEARIKERAPAALQKRIEERNRDRATPSHISERTSSPSTPATGPAEARPVVKGMFGAYLGKSMLGAKKPGGIAPVAPMFGTSARKDGGGGGGAGNGAGGSESGSGSGVGAAESGMDDKTGS